MKKYLKLALFISFLSFPFGVSATTADTLKGKNFIGIELNYGFTIYNRLTLDKFHGFSKEYKVNSKPKSYYDFKFLIVRGKSNVLIGLSLIQSEFRGETYSIGAGEIPYKGLTYPYYYNMYQRINYNVYYLNVGYSYNFRCAQKHTLSPSVELSIPLVYDFTINNYYDGNQASDSSKFNPTKNAKNDNTNFGRFPRFRLGISYRYNPIERLGITFNLSFMYAHTFDRKEPDSINYGSAFNQSNNYSYLAYTVKNQAIFMPSIGLNFKLTK